jgi:hypothetical protein
MNEKEIKITFTLEQVNAVLQRLGQLPYAQVADLVEGIKAIATSQIPASEEQPEDPVTD